MKFSLIKRIGAAITCAAVACSMFVFSTGAAGLKNISFGPCDSGAEIYLVHSNGEKSKVEGQDIMFADGNNKIVWRVPIDKSATIANLVLTVSQNYTLEISDKDGDWKDLRSDEHLKGVGECSNGNKKEIVYDVTSYIPNGEVYFRLGDQTTGNGWGGILWNCLLTYTKYTPEVITPYDTKGNFEFIPGSKLERRFIPEGKSGGAVAENGQSRYMDHTATVTYKLPVYSDKKGYLNMLLAANYIVKISVDDIVYKKIDAAEGGEDKAGFGTENKAMHTYEFNKLVKQYFKDAGNYDYLYVKVGDQTQDSGWGGQIFFVSVHYGVTGLYNPFVSSNAKSTAIRYRRPQKVVTYKEKITKTLIDDGLSDPNLVVGGFDDPGLIDEPADMPAIDEIPSTDPVIDPAIQDETSSTPEVQPISVAPDNSVNWVWVVVLGILGLILVGGAVTQFILMEKKRKSAENVSKD